MESSGFGPLGAPAWFWRPQASCSEARRFGLDRLPMRTEAILANLRRRERRQRAHNKPTSKSPLNSNRRGASAAESLIKLESPSSGRELPLPAKILRKAGKC